MQSMRLWIATALALVLAAAIWWTDKKDNDPQAKPKLAEGSERLLDNGEDDLVRVELKRPAEDSTIVLERSGKDWKITAPQAFGVDAETVNSLVKALTVMDSSALVDAAPKDYNRYGFAAPRLIVAAKRKDGKSTTVEFANESPIKGEYYARLAGSPKLYTVAGFAYSPLDKRLPDLRDKRIVIVDAATVKSIELTAKGATLEFAPTPNKDWRIVKPSAMRADGLAVEEILRRMADSRADLAATLDESLFAKGTPVATVKVTDAAGAKTFELRKNKDDYYAQTNGAPGIHKLGKDVAETLDKDLLAFRAKKVLDFGFSDLTKIEFRDGTKSSVFERKGADWQNAGKKVDGVPALVDKLRDLSILRFLETGMAAATIDATVHSATRKEKVAISKSGNMWVAQREGATELYEIDGKLIEDLQKAAASIK